MRRGVQAALVLLVVLALPVLWLFRPPAALPARFAAADCARLAVTDTASGRALLGVEDMALLPDGDTLILSAQDRRGGPEQRDGGLYEASLSRLAAGQGWAEPLGGPDGLAPHGIAVSSDGARLAVVDRSGGTATRLIAGRLEGGAFTPRHIREDPAFCRANDLAFTGETPWTVRVTLDRGDCGVSWADLRPGARTGRLVTLDLAGAAPPELEMAGLAFANGVAGLWVAETRAARLAHLLDRPVDLPGGPDNLTWDDAGGLVAALHPSLPRIAAYRGGFWDRAPSRIVRLGPGRGVEVLFDDPGGALFSGATVAVLHRGVLVAGSVLDAGVMLCRKGGG